jgi:type IV pilus assembly protein PilY1
MRNFFHKAVMLATGLGLCAPLAAEDIDLFIQPPDAAAGTPNVLILLDNTANWSRTVGGQSIFINEIGALISTLDSLPVNADGSPRFRVGLMMFTETGGADNNVDGGYVRAAIRDMTTANKTIYAEMLKSLDPIGDRSNAGKAGLMFAESYRYFDGGIPRSGNGKAKTDYRSNTFGTAQSRAVYALSGNALESKDGSPYRSPIIENDCGGNYIIYISNGAAQDPTADTATATAMLTEAATAAGISDATSTIPISPSDSQSNVADEWARFMRRSPHQVVTYTLDVDPVRTGQGPGWSALLKSTANVSNGKYFSVTAGNGGQEIIAALGRIFSEIQAVNSVFASVSLPVSVNTQGTYLNQVYVGQFRPDEDAFPRWAGNLKQYRLGILDGMLRTIDADGESAINAATGFITECARSYWTPSVTDKYWEFRPAGGCLAVANSDASNFPDGNVVEKGAQAHMLRRFMSVANRNMRTCLGNCTAGLMDFSTATAGITGPLLGATSDADRTQLINWHRGADAFDENTNGNFTEMRSTVHGDIVHSRPVALNYGTDAAPQVVVFYGGNDGVLRAVNGNRETSIGTVLAGSELWSFTPPEFFPHIGRLRDNLVPISFTGATEPPIRQPKPYGVDGPLTAFVSGGNTWLYATMRRGGRVMYAFDVSNITTDATSPSLMWKRGCPRLSDDTDCSTGFQGMGQTWAEPKVMRTLGYTSGDAPAPMLIMGGGYDRCEDGDPALGYVHTCTVASKGRHIYVMDAADGSLLRRFDTLRPVVADVFVVPDGTTGRAKFAYVADMGGNVYRISGATANAPFGSTAPADWTITRIASLGCDTAAGVSPSAACLMNRKFMFAPDIVEEAGTYYLLLGSGDREKPVRNFTAALGVQNYFFMIKDNPLAPDWLSSESANCGSDIICMDSLVEIGLADGDPDAATLQSAKGWRLALRAGEQVVTSAITVFGTTTFSSHEPTPVIPGACTSNLGTARVYNLRFRNAAALANNTTRDAEISGGGLPPSPVAGQVTLDNGVTVPFVIGASPISALESSLPSAPSTGDQPRAVTYWYIEK